MTPRDTFQQLRQASGKTDLAALQQWFDTLPAVPDGFMLGEWTGGVFNTGHPGEGQLGALRWAGKTFRGRNDVDPIVSRDAEGRRQANPVMGAASLRQVEHRGVVTATMVYDRHPVFDHFRLIDDRAVLGVMDRKGEDMPLYFWLERL